jgi:hypothetical protein
MLGPWAPPRPAGGGRHAAAVIFQEPAENRQFFQKMQKQSKKALFFPNFYPKKHELNPCFP